MKKFPNAIIIILGLLVVSWLLTYIIPSGAYDRKTDENGRVKVINDSYHYIDSEPLSFFDLMLTIPKGIEARADLIVLILLIGGSFYVIEKTGALSEGLSKMVSMLNGKEVWALVLLAFIFMVAGATIGLQEELIAMIPVLLLFGRSLGYNTFTILYTSFGSAIVGGAFSPSNPFAVLIAQNEAQLPLMSGAGFRLIVLGIVFLVWVLYLLRYAHKNRIEKEALPNVNEKMPLRFSVILSLLGVTFTLVFYGIIVWDWGFQEMSACFFVLGLAAGLIGQLGLNGTAEMYVAGFKEMIFACVVIGLAYSISLILKDGMVIDSIVYGLFGPLKFLPPALSAVIMMIGHSVLHIPVPSYSGQAIMTMPILVPLSDLIGISRQTCVLAYQYGAVMADMIIPTNGALMAVLAVASVTYDKWIRFIVKPMLLILGLAALTLIVATMLELS